MPPIASPLDVGDQPIDRPSVVLSGRRDRQTDGIQLDTRLGDLGDELVGPGSVGVVDDLVDVSDVENRYDSVDAHGQVGQPVPEIEQGFAGVLELLEIPGHTADEVVLLADAVE